MCWCLGGDCRGIVHTGCITILRLHVATHMQVTVAIQAVACVLKQNSKSQLLMQIDHSRWKEYSSLWAAYEFLIADTGCQGKQITPKLVNWALDQNSNIIILNENNYLQLYCTFQHLVLWCFVEVFETDTHKPTIICHHGSAQWGIIANWWLTVKAWFTIWCWNRLFLFQRCLH